MKYNKLNISIIVLCIFYSVGIFGLNSDNFEWFLNLTPFNLLLTFLILTINEPTENLNKYFINFCSVFLVGFIIEAIGVNTKQIFGNYEYSNVLGIGMFSTPFMIGVNWFLLAYGSFYLISKLKINKYLIPFLAAGLMTFLDFIIEPVAIKLNFWTWENNVVPFQNYLAWYLVSLIIHYFQLFYLNKTINKMAGIIFLIQIIFFTILNITLK